jgi:hypothetical protein
MQAAAWRGAGYDTHNNSTDSKIPNGSYHRGRCKHSGDGFSKYANRGGAGDFVFDCHRTEDFTSSEVNQMIWIVLIAFSLVFVILARRGNPNRGKNIFSNVSKIVSAEKDMEIRIQHASTALENEYRYQLKGYPGTIECYRDPENLTTLVLAKRVPSA